MPNALRHKMPNAQTLTPRHQQLTDINTFFSPFFQRSVGFDRIFDSMASGLMEEGHGGGYPPYDILEVDEDTYEISMALAGFKRKNIDIQFNNGVLTVEGGLGEQDDSKYLHRGIATRRFNRRFNLAEHIRVGDARLVDGMLTIHLKRELPEALKPRSIKILAK